MVPASEYLSFVTLIANSNLLNNLVNYHPIYVESSPYYYKNVTVADSTPRPVDYDHIFASSTFFPKCCPPGFSYDVYKKDCAPSSDTTPIYEELKVKVNLIRSGMSDCQVVADKFVMRKGVMQASTKDFKINLKIGKDRFSPGKYCLDKTVQSKAYIVQICSDRKYCAENKNWCVSKCCWNGYSYKGRNCQFTPCGGTLQDDKYNKYYEREDSYAFLYGLTDCPKQNVHRLNNLDFIISGNGSLVRKDNAKTYELGEYCLDSAVFTDLGVNRDDIVLLCDYDNRINKRLVAILVVVIIVFAGFLIAFLRSLLIYELNGLIVKLVACYAFVEATFWIIIAMKMIPVQIGDLCFVFGYIHALLSIARLSWLNVLEYEIWLTIGNKKSYTFKSKSSLCLKFICYSLYAITIAAVTMVIFIMSHRRIYPLPMLIIPQINLFTCVVQLDNYGALHLLIPAVILIIINVMLFGKILCCCPPEGKNDVYLISYSITDTNPDTFVMNNKEVLIVLKLALVNVITWLYYMGAFSRFFQADITLDNVGGKLPPPYL